jgi:hypothetical protein
MVVPDLRLLAYAPTRPLLRVVRLRETVVEPAPVSFDPGSALDDCVRREGWLVFTPNITVWGLPLPFGERAFRIATDTHVAANGVDERTVWLHGRDSPTVAEYDGVTRELRREVGLPGPQFSVRAATRSGFVLWEEQCRLYAWEPSQPPQLLLGNTTSS